MNTKTIIVDSKPYYVWNWNEKPAGQIPPAGIHPKAQMAMENEAASREGRPVYWDASFDCDATFPAKTPFSVEDGGNFVVSVCNGKKHWANRV